MMVMVAMLPMNVFAYDKRLGGILALPGGHHIAPVHLFQLLPGAHQPPIEGGESMSGLIVKDFLILRKTLRSYLLILAIYVAVARP